MAYSGAEQNKATAHDMIHVIVILLVLKMLHIFLALGQNLMKPPKILETNNRSLKQTKPLLLLVIIIYMILQLSVFSSLKTCVMGSAMGCEGIGGIG